MRAREPDEVGVAVRDGVVLQWERHGQGDTTIVFLPTWAIVHSRCWKAQVPYFARHHRVITFDGRGCGASSRPSGPDAYTPDQYVADAIAVLDATHTERAILVSLSAGALWSIPLAARCPDRVQGVVAIAPAVSLSASLPERDLPFDEPLETEEGWAKYNRHYWAKDYETFVRYFFAQMFNEPHSTKQIEDCVGWALETDAVTLTDVTQGLMRLDGDRFREDCSVVRCPVLVVHGDRDAIRPLAGAQALANLTRGRMVTIAGGGHGPHAREPVMVNRLIADFVDRTTSSAAARVVTWTRSLRRQKRVLYLSSPIGLGHARRDLAIAKELRGLHPDAHIDWLAQHPVTELLGRAGERVHPASAYLANESAHIESEAGEHDLHAFQAIRRMDETLINNFMVFHDLVESEHYDLVVGDEAWEVDHFLHENPELKRFAFAWMTDFVGWLPMSDGGEQEAALTADYNAEMIAQRARYRRLRDVSVFIGSPDDVVPDPFGAGLPSIRAWTESEFRFSGYVTGSQDEAADRDELRARFGYGSDERVCVVTVGGSGVGEALLDRVVAATDVVRARVAGIRFEVVTGPRIDPQRFLAREGVTFHAFVPDVHLRLAACDIAIVQGGLTTCMELATNARPFIYVPLEHHFEQQIHVPHRLQRYGAGTRMRYADLADPERLATALIDGLDRPQQQLPVERDGAQRAAAMIAELL